MTTSQSSETAGKARSGIGDAVVGKAKEVAGAVTGSDSLAAEGQLQQSRAHAIRESAAEEAIADAEAAEAGQQLRRAQDEAAAQRGQVEARAAEQASTIRDEQLHQQTVAERSAELEESAGQQAAEDHARRQMVRAGEQEQTRLAATEEAERAAERRSQDAVAQADAQAEAAERIREGST